MRTIRRIYAYLLAFAGLATLSFAVANLGQVVLDALLRRPSATPEYVRDTISLYAAAALVGLPAWLVHWLWTERWARADDRERASTLRRLYLYTVLAGAMLVMLFTTREIVFSTIYVLTASRGGPGLEEPVRWLPYALVALIVWLGHWRIAARDRRLVGESGGSATLRRWYVYGAAFIGLVTLLVSASALLETLWRQATQPTPGGGGVGFAAPIAGAVVGLAMWLLHWRVLPERVSTGGRDDGTAVLRSVYLFLGLSVGVVGTLIGISQLLYYAVGRLLGVDRPGEVGGDLLQAAARPSSLAIVFAVAWAYHRYALSRQAGAFDEAPRQAGIRRLYTYIVALIALGAWTYGVAGLLWTLGDVLLAAPLASSGGGWRGSVALYATLVMVGLPLWLVHWRPTPSSDSERHSLARRLYLYLTLIAAMLSLIGGGADTLYQLIRVLLGTGWSVQVTSDLSHGLAVAIVAAIAAMYHWRILRADAPRDEPSTTEAPAPAAQAIVEIRASDSAALERALEALRSTGVEVAVIRGVG